MNKTFKLESAVVTVPTNVCERNSQDHYTVIGSAVGHRNQVGDPLKTDEN